MGVRSTWVMVVVVGCGRFGFDDHRGSIDAVGDGTRDGSGDGTASASCITLALSDNFDATTISPQWSPYGAPPVSIAEMGGTLQIALVANMNGNHYGGLASIATLDLRDHCIFITFTSTPTMGATEMQFAVGVSSSQYAGFAVGNGQLTTYIESGSTTFPTTVPYDPVAHHVLRIRESSGSTFYESSPDGATYTVQLSQPTPFAFSAINVLIQAGTYASMANPGIAVFDNFDI